jgi:hypothetical protein
VCFFEIGSCKLFAWAVFKPRSSWLIFSSWVSYSPALGWLHSF